jgi:hypothetical protein
LDVARALLHPTGGAKSKYLGRGHFFPFFKKGPIIKAMNENSEGGRGW